MNGLISPDNPKHEISIALHSYAKKSLNMDCATVADVSPLPATPEPQPAKKHKHADTPPHVPVSNSTLLAAIEKIGQMQQQSLQKLQSVEDAVRGNTDSIKDLVSSLECVNVKVVEIDGKVKLMEDKINELSAENEGLRQKCVDMDLYKRRWNLRIAGIPERNGENIKNVVLELFSVLSPDIADFLPQSLDIVHRLGSHDNKRSRRVIAQFISRSHRDKVWKAARTSTVLKDKNIKILEDLSQETKDARSKLWPLVDKARKDGQKAGFSGANAIINGKMISAKDLKASA